MKLFRLIITFILVCMVAFGILVLLASWADRREEKTNNFNQLYSIEPESLLDDIEKGKIDVFVPINEEPPWPSPDQQIPVPWTQKDYFRIVNAAFEFVWNDTITDWQLNNMSFNLDCAKYNIGFQAGIFKFFKNEEINRNKIRIERIVNIDPRDKTVYVGENQYSPRLDNWSSIDLKHNQLSAEEILRIADNAGGKTNRLSTDNGCNISLFLAPGSAYKGWWIRYSRSDDNSATLFQAEINPSTGEIHLP